MVLRGDGSAWLRIKKPEEPGKNAESPREAAAAVSAALADVIWKMLVRVKSAWQLGCFVASVTRNSGKVVQPLASRSSFLASYTAIIILSL
jgi:hypothetical protein